MQRVEVIRLTLQDGPVDTLRISQPALLVQGQGTAKSRSILRWG